MRAPASFVMWGSATFYLGAGLAITGLALVVRPVRRFRVTTRARGVGVAAAGVLMAGLGLALPVRESRVTRPMSQLDEFVPVWQFREIHTIRVAAPPSRVFEAVRLVRADEIALFHTLTWIRRGGRPVPTSILNPGNTEPIIDVATRSGFVRLAEEAPRELVLGAFVMRPPGAHGPPTPEVFRKPLAPGFGLVAMNFLVKADGPDRSTVSTETRVVAGEAAARRRFAVYWRIIYPGSAIIRRMWLRAIQQRAITP